MNYLNTDELTDEGQAKLVSSDDYFNGNWGTPLTLIVQKDEIVDMIVKPFDEDNIKRVIEKTIAKK